MAGHRSSSGRRARPEVAPDRSGAAHRAAGSGHLRVQVLAAAAAVGAVTTGVVTALLPGSPASADRSHVDESASSPVLAASTGVLRGRMNAVPAETMPAETMLPVAYALDDSDRDATIELRVASVEKAGRLATRLADLHAREARTSALIRSGGLDGWIAEALKIMNLPQDLAPGVKQIIMSESGGNPHAINTWDSNALRGTPSRGLMQTIPSTFRAYVHPDVANRSINDPVANITAGVRYMIDRYGVDTVRAGGRSSSAGNYLGY